MWAVSYYTFLYFYFLAELSGWSLLAWNHNFPMKWARELETKKNTTTWESIAQDIRHMACCFVHVRVCWTTSSSLVVVVFFGLCFVPAFFHLCESHQPKESFRNLWQTPKKKKNLKKDKQIKNCFVMRFLSTFLLLLLVFLLFIFLFWALHQSRMAKRGGIYIKINKFHHDEASFSFSNR